MDIPLIFLRLWRQRPQAIFCAHSGTWQASIKSQ